MYQVYLRSFADSNSDGIGDLLGLHSRITYLQKLGIDAIWISPFYPSAFADGGYDVDDYRDVDSTFGGFREFALLISSLHAAEIKVLCDIVPNHTSVRHSWFREALRSPPGSPARDRYIFRDGIGEDNSLAPSDWSSKLGGPAWTRVSDGQWYLHLFTPAQPDLNWQNLEVRKDFLKTIRFWSDLGVDGFRVDVAHGLAKDIASPLPSMAEINNLPPGSHLFWDRDEVQEIYTEWRQVFNQYDPPRMAIAEAEVPVSRLSRYASPTGLGQAFCFDLLRSNWDKDEFLAAIDENLAQAELVNSSPTWVISNHDSVRHATRYGLPQGTLGAGQDGKAWLRSNGMEPPLDTDLGLRRARAAALFILALPGSPYLYQGEELGLHEVGDLPAHVLQDPIFERSGRTIKGRDGCRVPLPWTRTRPSFGFSTVEAYLPQPDWFSRCSVEAQDADPTSTLNMYRRAIALRRKLEGPGDLHWVASRHRELHFIRPGGWHCVVNFGPNLVPLPGGEVIITSGPLVGSRLPADTTAWIVQPERV
ncbi:glycoside hydrolase family 13 protein [Phytoactinopolyspora halotolerans]|uniref:glycoside hydrolase family 13 protein n=1 Tax=Phytoactinopolyspora halotolerans TaxID=1981512 RepID=UPI001C2070B5|nr:glycoside hydrolase family 13 protein [Phytoactinopolyspora halotolerans]